MAANENPLAGSTAEGAKIMQLHVNHSTVADIFQEQLTDVFADVADMPRWVPYCLMRNPDKEKSDKIPFNGRHGLSTKKPDHWCPKAEATATATEYGLTGVGLVFTNGVEIGDERLVGLDFDDVDFGNFTLPFKSYAEKSPSGTGVRSFIWVPKEWAARFKDNSKVQYPGCGHAEAYIGSAPRFLTTTFNVIDSSPIAHATDDDLAVLASSWLKPADPPSQALILPEQGGSPVDLARFSLSPDQRQLIKGRGNINRSDVLHGLLIKLIDGDVSREDILATVLETSALMQVCLDHRRDIPERALEFAQREIAKAYEHSQKAKRDALVSYNKGWKPKPPTKGDAELQWLLANVPTSMKAYTDWYQANAVRPHPIFALMSNLLLIQALVGRNVKLPSHLRPNLWVLLLAPTESGKGDVPKLAKEALKQIGEKRINGLKMLPAIPQFEEAFGSAESFWWFLEECPQAILADEELAKTLTTIIAAPEGSPRYAMRRALLVLYDAATKPQVAPIRYSRRVKSNREMQPLHYPFMSIFGTGVPRDIESFSASAADDGLLNRFLVVVVEDLPAVGTIKDYPPLPEEVLRWAGKLHITGAFDVLSHTANGASLLEVYDDLVVDWAAEMAHGSTLAQDMPGVWGRYAEKVLKVAMLYAVADSGKVTRAGFEWARRFVRWALSDFARHFAAEGGGAANEGDALAKAFMAVFDAPSLKDEEILPFNVFAKYSRRWKRCKDERKRNSVIGTLIADGLIEEKELKSGGIGYRKL